MFNFFKPKDFTEEWVVESERELLVDLARGTVCGIALGAPISDFSFLGPVEDVRELKRGNLCYYSRGLTIEFEEEGGEPVFDSAYLIYLDYMEQGFKPFRGECTYQGKPLPTSFKEIVQVLGEPVWTDADEEEIVLRFDCGELEVEFEFTVDYQLQHISFWKK